MRHLLDVNVLLALAWPNHVHHGAARQWFSAAHSDGWLTCSVTESGFIRVSSNARVTPDARTPAEAAPLLHHMCAIAGHAFLVDSVSPAKSHEDLGSMASASSEVTDAHLILLARHAEASFATFDRHAAQAAARCDVPRTVLEMESGR